MPATTYQLTLAFPDFSQYKVNDLFRGLGPVAVFSAKHHWTAPRTIQLRKKEVKIKNSFKKEKQTHQ